MKQTFNVPESSHMLTKSQMLSLLELKFRIICDKLIVLYVYHLVLLLLFLLVYHYYNYQHHYSPWLLRLVILCV